MVDHMSLEKNLEALPVSKGTLPDDVLPICEV